MREAQPLKLATNSGVARTNPYTPAANTDTVMEILGHSQISLTMNTYSHVLPALQVQAARRLNPLLPAEA